jgi:enoyl reductase-like protein
MACAMTIAYVPALDATVAVWREDDGWTARVDDRDGRRQTVIPHRTALDAICAIAATTPEHAWVRELAARATADAKLPGSPHGLPSAVGSLRWNG